LVVNAGKAKKTIVYLNGVIIVRETIQDGR
jgi:hypothetical protein